ncbi:apolipoprotein N-acyltransferase [Kineococcus xinjiangensis]|uniref:apolipoprotein N-acyltransferase n=1 Tax=Kineococcus xinjiangensis TaxID=512762 RepID=UPI001FE4C898|nr:apolipoprotein N-acyltransferase [Kineococcus xinjiangensis]
MPRPADRPLPLLPAALLAAAGGGLSAAAFPGLGWWPLAPVGVAALVLAVAGQRPRRAALLGLLHGWAFFVPLLQWSGVYVGALPWLALATLCALFHVLLAALLPRALRAPWGLAPLAVAGTWVAVEALRARVPFGGFPWGRLAFSQADAPTLGLASLGGSPLVSFAVALSGALLALAVTTLARRGRLVQLPDVRLPSRGTGGRATRAAAAAAALAVAAMGAGALLPRPVDASEGTAQVAAVQGNTPEPGLDFNAERRAVLDNHARATLELAREVRAGRAPQPELVLWPENSSDIDPLLNPDAAAVISRAVEAVDAPTLVGAVLQGPGEGLSNAGIVWRPGTGPTERYVKQRPAPFGEYMPYRSFFRIFSDKVDLVRQDFVAGTSTSLLPMGPALVGDIICFEVLFDDLAREAVAAGADLLVVQTNSATFGTSNMAPQQLAMSRLRAVETGRSVVHVSTVGISALITPDGVAHQSTELLTSAVLQGELPLRSGLTFAVRHGLAVELFLCGVGVLLLLAARRRPRAAAVASGPPVAVDLDVPAVRA